MHPPILSLIIAETPAAPLLPAAHPLSVISASLAPSEPAAMNGGGAFSPRSSSEPGGLLGKLKLLDAFPKQRDEAQVRRAPVAQRPWGQQGPGPAAAERRRGLARPWLQEFFQRTMAGGIITLVASLFMFLLFCSELSEFTACPGHTCFWHLPWPAVSGAQAPAARLPPAPGGSRRRRALALLRRRPIFAGADHKRAHSGHVAGGAAGDPCEQELPAWPERRAHGLASTQTLLGCLCWLAHAPSQLSRVPL